MANIAEDVKAIIVEKLGVDASEVTETASFTNDLGADSLDIVELVNNSEIIIGVYDNVTITNDNTENKYIVQEGETVASICLKFYETIEIEPEIRLLNGLLDGEEPIPGQKLYLP